jgi:hypothetical protein
MNIDITTTSSPTASDINQPPPTLPTLIERFESEEENDEPDVVLPLRTLRVSNQGLIAVGGRRYSVTSWSRRQLATRLGLRWDRWFDGAGSEDVADELNRRFARDTGDVRLRTCRTSGTRGDGELRAIVGPMFSPVLDSTLARMVLGAMACVDSDYKIIRSAVTDRSTSYVVAVGQPSCPGRPGDIWGGLSIVNSNLGYCALTARAWFLRLICGNGLAVPMPGAELLRRRHHRINEDVLSGLLVDRMKSLPETLRLGGVVLTEAVDHPVNDIEAEVRTVLAGGNLPAKLLPQILEAYAAEPHPSAFGVAQAVTWSKLRLSPEVRLELEVAAGRYLRSVNAASS